MGSNGLICSCINNVPPGGAAINPKMVVIGTYPKLALITRSPVTKDRGPCAECHATYNFPLFMRHRTSLMHMLHIPSLHDHATCNLAHCSCYMKQPCGTRRELTIFLHWRCILVDKCLSQLRISKRTYPGIPRWKFEDNLINNCELKGSLDRPHRFGAFSFAAKAIC